MRSKIALSFGYSAGLGTLLLLVAGLHGACPSAALDKVFSIGFIVDAMEWDVNMIGAKYPLFFPLSRSHFHPHPLDAHYFFLSSLWYHLFISKRGMDHEKNPGMFEACG